MQTQLVSSKNPPLPELDRPVRIAVCGEVRSGKSTVLNTLLRARILPDNLGRTHRPVIHVGHRAEAGVETDHADGRGTQRALADGPAVAEDATEVRLWSDHAHLAGFEFVEVPLTKAEELTEAQIALVRSADIMIWVTIASQAWRLTEKTLVEQFGDARPAQAILAVTRADKLRSDADRAKLKERMARETTELFSACIFVNGARAQIEKSAGSDPAWALTGAGEIVSALSDFATDIRTRRAEEAAEAEAAGSRVVELAAFRARAAGASDRGEDPRPDPISQDLIEDLLALAGDMPGLIVAGLLPAGDCARNRALAGDPERADAVAGFCQGLLDTVLGAYPPDASPGTDASVVLSAAEHRFLCETVSGKGLVYLMADAGDMSHGVAQNALSRLVRRLSDPG